MDSKNYDNCSTLEELLDVEYGEKGTPMRELFDAETKEFLGKSGGIFVL